MSDGPGDVEMVAGALAGRPAAVRALVAALTPVVQARVARALLRNASGRRQGRDLRQDVTDFTQEVFTSLFADNGRALRAWDPSRGLSLPNFAGLLAEHQVAAILRSGRRSPWTDEPMVAEDIESSAGSVEPADAVVYSREVLRELHRRLRAELSPRGLQLFQSLIVEDRTADDVCGETGMTAEVVYAWRSRLGKLARRLAHEIDSDLSRSPRTPGKGELRSA